MIYIDWSGNIFLNLTKKLNNKSIKNAGWIIGEQIFQMIIALAVSVLTARYLGPTNYGSLNYTAAIVTFFTSFATLGMDSVVIKIIIDNPEEEGKYLGTCIVFRIVSALLSIFCIMAVISILNPADEVKLLLGFLQSIQLIFLAIQLFDIWFQRHLNSKNTAKAKMFASILVSCYKIFLLITAKDIAWFAFSNSLTAIIVAFMLFVFYKKAGGQKLQFDFSYGIKVLKSSYHFILSGLMVVIYSQMDKIMIGSMLGDIDVGYYTTATAICGMWVFIPTAIINSFRPTILEIKSGGDDILFLKRLRQLYSFIIWLCIAASLFVFVFGKYMILILYGEAYLGAVDALRIVIWYEVFSILGTARGIWIVSEGKYKYVKYYLGIGAIVNVVLNYFLIPIYGIEGAAMATLITQITTCILAPLLFKETRIHTKYVLESFLLKGIIKWRK